jgi:hypothetical protein
MDDVIAARARRRTAAVVAAIAAVLVLIAAIGAGATLLLRNRQAPPTAAMRPTPGAATGTDSGSTASASTRDPSDLTWTTVAGARVPVSATAGPHDATAGRARGFDRSPLGAVLAAAHVSVRLSPQVGPDVFVPTLREQTVGGGAAALSQLLDEEYEQARADLGLPYGQPAGRLYSTARGYRVDVSSPTSASVRLLIEGPGKYGATVLVELRLETRWLGADWALVAPPSGTWEAVTAVVTDTAGYIRFADGS